MVELLKIVPILFGVLDVHWDAVFDRLVFAVAVFIDDDVAAQSLDGALPYGTKLIAERRLLAINLRPRS